MSTESWSGCCLETATWGSPNGPQSQRKNTPFRSFASWVCMESPLRVVDARAILAQWRKAVQRVQVAGIGWPSRISSTQLP